MIENFEAKTNLNLTRIASREGASEAADAIESCKQDLVDGLLATKPWEGSTATKSKKRDPMVVRIVVMMMMIVNC